MKTLALGLYEHEGLWEYHYELLKQYKAKYGNIFVPVDYKTFDNIWLGEWLYLQCRELKNCTLSKEQAEKLYSLGVKPCGGQKRSWYENYKVLQQYCTTTGHADMPKQYETETGIEIGKWLYKQKIAYRRGKLKPEKAMLLQKLQIDMSADRPNKRKSHDE